MIARRHCLVHSWIFDPSGTSNIAWGDHLNIQIFESPWILPIRATKIAVESLTLPEGEPPALNNILWAATHRGFAFAGCINGLFVNVLASRGLSATSTLESYLCADTPTPGRKAPRPHQLNAATMGVSCYWAPSPLLLSFSPTRHRELRLNNHLP